MKLLALLLILLVLAGCGSAAVVDDDDYTTETTTEVATTTEEATEAPIVLTRVGAVMPPLQGGPMLYTFPSSRSWGHTYCEKYGNPIPLFHIGLVNEIGRVVTQPRYTATQYLHNAQGRVIGLLAYRDATVTHYTLQGAATQLPFQAQAIRPMQDGRHWIVQRYGRLDGFDWNDGAYQGLFDWQTRQFIIPPTEGLTLNAHGTMLLGTQRTARSFDSPLVRAFVRDADGNERELPEGWRAQRYFPETSWFEIVTGERFSTEMFIVDREFNRVPELLTRWHIDRPFEGRNHMIIRSRSDHSTSTWADREGNISPLRYGNIRRTGQMYFVRDDWNAQTVSIYDDQLNRLHNGQAAMLWDVFDPGSNYPHFLAALNEQGQVQRMWGTSTSQPINLNGFVGYFRTSQHSGALARRNNRWYEIIPHDFINSVAGELIASSGNVTRNSVRLWFGYSMELGYRTLRTITVDWSGNVIDCPPALSRTTGIRSAGEQGPHYWWVERDGQRGFVNERGQWLFIYGQ